MRTYLHCNRPMDGIARCTNEVVALNLSRTVRGVQSLGGLLFRNRVAGSSRISI